jgi:hypothetical protein
MACIPYCASQHYVSRMEKALIDCGAKGGMCVEYKIVLECSEHLLMSLDLQTIINGISSYTNRSG